MKETRYYDYEGDVLCIYNAPYADTSESASYVTKEQMVWYRAHFRMVKSSGKVCPKEYR